MSKLIIRGINERGLLIPIKGRELLINSPPNIKKVILNPIV
jgi:hypothetical protein